MSLKESCGVFGVYAPAGDAARLTFFALFALQHRGQESSGIAAADGQRLRIHTGMGLVSHVFDEAVLGRLTGPLTIGHNRYSTAGSSLLINAQPMIAQGPLGEIALVHNGNIVNAVPLRQELAERGHQFQTSTDSEVIVKLIVSAPGESWVDKVRYAMRRLQGAYSLALLTTDTLIGVRDPLGIRPLCLGRIDGGWMLASETCALDHIGANFLRAVKPGEIVVINQKGMASFQGVESVRQATCAFEFIYFARPDSVINGRLLYWAREAMGRRLVREHPVDADLVIGVPDSATIAAIAYSQESGIPFSEGLLKNRYAGRTFIEPDQRIRELGARFKYNPLREVLGGKRLVVVDDSIVRGTTTPHVVALLRKAGAKEIHLRICAPPICHPCFFGMDTPTRWELIAAQKSVPEIKEFVGADSLGYLSLDGLVESIALPRETLCLACFNGTYPIPVQLEMDKLALETLPQSPKATAVAKP